MNEEARKIRRRALRAARVATIGLVLLAPGCYVAHDRQPRASGSDAAVGATDAGAAIADAFVRRPSDAGAAIADAFVPDAGTFADAGVCDQTAGWEEWQACCDAIGWDFNRGCMAWGPFVPPGEVA